MNKVLFLYALAPVVPAVVLAAQPEHLVHACINGSEEACLELKSQRCDKRDLRACTHLALSTNGQCASPRYMGGCNYDSLAVVRPAWDEE